MPNEIEKSDLDYAAIVEILKYKITNGQGEPGIFIALAVTAAVPLLREIAERLKEIAHAIAPATEKLSDLTKDR
jgi:hypothetical protein